MAGPSTSKKANSAVAQLDKRSLDGALGLAKKENVCIDLLSSRFLLICHRWPSTILPS